MVHKELHIISKLFHLFNFPVDCPPDTDKCLTTTSFAICRCTLGSMKKQNLNRSSDIHIATADSFKPFSWSFCFLSNQLGNYHMSIQNLSSHIYHKANDLFTRINKLCNFNFTYLAALVQKGFSLVMCQLPFYPKKSSCYRVKEIANFPCLRACFSWFP